MEDIEAQSPTTPHASDAIPEEGVDIPFDAIDPSTLDELIKAFVLREGTDYGASEVPVERKVESIRRQLKTGRLKLVYDLATESGSIVSTQS